MDIDSATVTLQRWEFPLSHGFLAIESKRDPGLLVTLRHNSSCVSRRKRVLGRWIQVDHAHGPQYFCRSHARPHGLEPLPTPSATSSSRNSRRSSPDTCLRNIPVLRRLPLDLFRPLDAERTARGYALLPLAVRFKRVDALRQGTQTPE